MISGIQSQEPVMQRGLQIGLPLPYTMLGQLFSSSSLSQGYFEVSVVIHTSWDLCSKGLEFFACRQILGSAKLSSKQHFTLPVLSNSSIPSKVFNTK